MTPNKEKAIAALLTHATKKSAAEAAGIDPRTMRRYFDDADFQQAYRAAFGSMVEDATRQAQQTIRPALDVLKEIMEDTEINPAARVTAAKTAIEYAIRLTDQNDLAERLAVLERGRQ